MRIVILVLFIVISSNHCVWAETITGSACYRYSDNESINEARDIALSMAKRDALEGYSVFVSSSATVQNMVLKNDLIASLTAGLLRNLRISAKSEDPRQKQVCRTIQADVEPFEIKSQITAKVNSYRRKHSNFESGLPEDQRIKVLKAKAIQQTLTDEGTCPRRAACLIVVAMCKFGTPLMPTNFVHMRIIHYDEDGIPERMYKDYVSCENKSDIVRFHLKLPDEKNLTSSFEIVK